MGAFDKEAIKAVPKAAQLKIMEQFKAAKPVNGWMFTTKTGIYGTDYIQRAMITAIGLGADRPQDAVYPTGETDAEGKDFDAASNKYLMHFDKGQLPPVKGFWSLTMYDDKYFFVANPLNRYTLSERNKFVTNPAWFGGLVSASRVTREDKRAELATCPQGKVCAHVAYVLAKRNTTFHHRRFMEAAGNHCSEVRIN